MNQNDMDRYFWRTGQRWSGDSRSREEIVGRIRLPRRVVMLIYLSFVVTLLILVYLHVSA
jgi:hypothetical protein